MLRVLRGQSRASCRGIPPSADLLHLITALCFAKVIIDLLHALPEQALLHRICVFRHFVVIFVKIIIQVKFILPLCSLFAHLILYRIVVVIPHPIQFSFCIVLGLDALSVLYSSRSTENIPGHKRSSPFSESPIPSNFVAFV
jgi:hypothetical protein